VRALVGSPSGCSLSSMRSQRRHSQMLATGTASNGDIGEMSMVLFYLNKCRSRVPANTKCDYLKFSKTHRAKNTAKFHTWFTGGCLWPYLSLGRRWAETQPTAKDDTEWVGPMRTGPIDVLAPLWIVEISFFCITGVRRTTSSSFQ
jgi:hypothetical protein